jgi:hypothetical protein
MALRRSTPSARLISYCETSKPANSRSTMLQATPSSKPRAWGKSDWIGGFAADAPTGSMGGTDGSTSQLVQAMASIEVGGGAADDLNTAPLGAETSQHRDWRRTAGVALVVRTISERGGVASTACLRARWRDEIRPGQRKQPALARSRHPIRCGGALQQHRIQVLQSSVPHRIARLDGGAAWWRCRDAAAA